MSRPAGIVVAGGRASRLGGADKASLHVDGAALVDHALTALSGAAPLVLVGSEHLHRPGVLITLEDPPLGGPAAALAAGLRAVEAADVGPSGAPELVWLLACDLPRAQGLVATVREELAARPLRGDEDGAIIIDATGRDQWLAGVYRTRALRGAFDAVGDVDGAPLRRVVGQLALRRVEDEHGDAVDLDTWDDVNDYAGATQAPVAKEEKQMSRTPPPELPEWIADVAPALGLDPDSVPTQLLLDLTSDVAHGVTRPAGPVTTYLMGRAVAAGASIDEAAATVQGRVEAWKAAHPRDEEGTV